MEKSSKAHIPWSYRYNSIMKCLAQPQDTGGGVTKGKDISSGTGTVGGDVANADVSAAGDEIFNVEEILDSRLRGGKVCLA